MTLHSATCMATRVRERQFDCEGSVRGKGMAIAQGTPNRRDGVRTVAAISGNRVGTSADAGVAEFERDRKILCASAAAPTSFSRCLPPVAVSVASVGTAQAGMSPGRLIEAGTGKQVMTRLTGGPGTGLAPLICLAHDRGRNQTEAVSRRLAGNPVGDQLDPMPARENGPARGAPSADGTPLGHGQGRTAGESRADPWNACWFVLRCIACAPGMDAERGEARRTHRNGSARAATVWPRYRSVRQCSMNVAPPNGISEHSRPRTRLMPWPASKTTRSRRTA